MDKLGSAFQQGNPAKHGKLLFPDDRRRDKETSYE